MSEEKNEEIKTLIDELEDKFEAWEELISEIDGNDLSEWGKEYILSEGYFFCPLRYLNTNDLYTTIYSNRDYSAFEILEKNRHDELEEAFNKWVKKQIDEDTDVCEEYKLKEAKDLTFQNADQFKAVASSLEQPTLRHMFEDLIESEACLHEGEYIEVDIEDIIDETLTLEDFCSFRNDVDFYSLYRDLAESIESKFSDLICYTQMFINEQRKYDDDDFGEYIRKRGTLLRLLNDNRANERSEIYDSIQLLVAKIDLIAEKEGYELHDEPVEEYNLQELVEKFRQLSSYQKICIEEEVNIDKSEPKRRRPTL